ncbi:hypothetical protein ACFWYW_11040 [Nonomuraea sp. NPDC059023]|uniref:hypothetical protein n=1 Tax=unclassified Nonomuraea TaxID=2593643 RepID=UPI0036A05786
MTEPREIPDWALRLREQRRANQWSQKRLARELFKVDTESALPEFDSVIRRIRDHEWGRHRPNDPYLLLYCRVFRLSEAELFADRGGESRTAEPNHPDDAVDLATWLEQSNIGSATIDYLANATHRLALDYARRPPLEVFKDATALQQRIYDLLRGGRQRLSQTRFLLTISAELFALNNLLASDLGRYSWADSYGYAAWTCAEEADSDPARALALCSQSKTARWEGRFEDAARLARRGYEICPAGEPRVLLAVSEAAALQGMGDIVGAHEALILAQRARDDFDGRRPRTDAWFCPRSRHATYASQVELGAGDPAAALREVTAADAAWAQGDPWVYGTWAQIRIGAAMAHVMLRDIEAASSELASVFELGPEYRVVTIAERMGQIDRLLQNIGHQDMRRIADLRERIRAFQSGSLGREVAAISGRDRALDAGTDG